MQDSAAAWSYLANMDATPQATVGAEVWPPCGLHYYSDSLCHRHINQATRSEKDHLPRAYFDIQKSLEKHLLC